MWILEVLLVLEQYGTTEIEIGEVCIVPDIKVSIIPYTASFTLFFLISKKESKKGGIQKSAFSFFMKYYF